MAIKLLLVALALPTLGLCLDDQEVDVGHWDPAAERKLFETHLEWSVERLEIDVDNMHFDVMSFFRDGLVGTTDWALSVRDSPRLEHGQRIGVMRDYEDVLLRAALVEELGSLRTADAEQLEVWGGMERERVSFESCREEGEWQLVLPKGSELDASGLLGLQPWVDLSGLAPPASLELGGSWQVPMAALEELLFPVGHPATLLAPLGWARVADVDVPTGGAIDSAEGMLEATWVSDPEDGNLSTIELELEAELVLSPGAALAAAGQVAIDGRQYQPADSIGGAEALAGELHVDIEGTGELVWNRSRGAFESLELPLDFESTLGLSFEFGSGPRVYAVSLEGDFEGQAKLDYGRGDKQIDGR